MLEESLNSNRPAVLTLVRRHKYKIVQVNTHLFRISVTRLQNKLKSN